MKKVFFILFLSILCNLSSVNSVYAGWPFNRTAGIEGQVTDATTGKPIENVIISCDWEKAFLSPGGDIQRTFAQELAVTDKEGRYKIPGKLSFHIFSYFSRREITFRHPLYETREFGASQNKDERGDYISVPIPEEGNYSNYIHEKDGIIHFDLKLMSLEEKYKRVKELGQAFEFYHEIAGQADKYIKLSKELGIIKKIDFNFILQRWSEITDTLPETHAKESIQEYIEIIRKELLSGELYE